MNISQGQIERKPLAFPNFHPNSSSFRCPWLALFGLPPGQVRDLDSSIRERGTALNHPKTGPQAEVVSGLSSETLGTAQDEILGGSHEDEAVFFCFVLAASHLSET